MSELAQAEIAAEIRATPALVAQLELLADLEARIAKLREREAELEVQRGEARAKISRKIDLGWWTIGDFTVRRTRVEPRPSVDAWKAIDEGVIDEAALRPYMTARRPFERWTLKRRRRRVLTA